MSSCLSGGSRNYNINLDLIKFPVTSSWTSNYSSSTLSKSNNSVSTRKARTPRKRPNQTYNEAASILSTAYPNLFTTKHLIKSRKFTKPSSPLLFEPAGLFTPSKIEQPKFSKNLNLFEKPSQVSSSGAACDEYEGDFGTESMILEVEVEEGIDSIMGNLSMENEDMRLSKNTCYGYSAGLGLEFGNGMRNESKAMKNGDEGDDWWRFPSVDVADITRKIAEIPTKKKRKKLECGKRNKEDLGSAVSKEAFGRTPGGLLLKLNYDDILSVWADKGSPFTG